MTWKCGLPGASWTAQSATKPSPAISLSTHSRASATFCSVVSSTGRAMFISIARPVPLAPSLASTAFHRKAEAPCPSRPSIPRRNQAGTSAGRDSSVWTTPPLPVKSQTTPVAARIITADRR